MVLGSRIRDPRSVIRDPGSGIWDPRSGIRKKPIPDPDAMLQCLHFRDNAKIDDAGYFKVRPIFANLNKAGHWFVNEGQFSVDEVMIPYFRRHSSKQFIHGKPIWYGYKVWALCTSGGSGALLWQRHAG